MRPETRTRSPGSIAGKRGRVAETRTGPVSAAAPSASRSTSCRVATCWPSLGDPIGSRLVLPPDAQYRVGHAYKPVVWAMARYTAADVHPDDQQLADARATLACGDIPTLIAAISEPLTPQRFLINLTLAPRLTLLRIPVDPAEAKATLCR